MTRTVGAVFAFALLLSPAAAVGQGAQAPGDAPLAPLSPSDPGPAAPQEEQEPAPEPAQPVDNDDALGATESIALGAMIVVLIGGVGVAISREGRKRRQQDGGKRRRRRSARPARTPSRVAEASGGKRPPPPPRKRRPKPGRRSAR
jgi:hypothetical protein